MYYAVNAEQMEYVDAYTRKEIGIPSAVLMERAALQAARHVMAFCNRKSDKILVVCGTGNNGGDGIATARILHEEGYSVDIMSAGNWNHMSEELSVQWTIAQKKGLSIRGKCNYRAYTVIIDAIFGIGLNRVVTGEYAKLIREINESGTPIIALDVPSGISADNGKIMGAAIKANVTITFGFMKVGLLLYPGAEHAGTIHVENIGHVKEALSLVQPVMRVYETSDLSALPKRIPNSNKGTYGHVLIIAGSSSMTGAAYLAAAGAYRTGPGLVRVLTCKEGQQALRTTLPEAQTDCYENMDDDTLMRHLQWADAVAIGPGLGIGKESRRLLSAVLSYTRVPTVFDADALNMIAERMNEDENCKDIVARIEYMGKLLPKRSIITPHIRELGRLLNLTTAQITGGQIQGVPLGSDVVCSAVVDITDYCTYNNDVAYVIKDARTVIAQGDRKNLNTSGNDGMATGGSGDVQTGIITCLAALGLSCYEAAALGTYLHGLAGVKASEKYGRRAMMAGDIIECIPEVLKEYDK